MKKYKIYLSVIFVLFITISWSHPVHISTSHIYYEKAKKGFYFETKIFTNDLQKDIYKTFSKQINLNNITKNERILLLKYLQKNVFIKVQNKIYNHFTLDDIETKNTSVIFKYHFKFTKKPPKILLHFSVLLDLFRDQTDLVIFDYNNIEKGLTFNHSNREYTITLKE